MKAFDWDAFWAEQARITEELRTRPRRKMTPQEQARREHIDDDLSINNHGRHVRRKLRRVR